MKIVALFIACCAAAVLSGCVGDFLKPKDDPTQFYILRSIPPKADWKADVPAGVQVNILPFSLPSYLGRHQMVVLEGGGKVEISEFNRWAELPVSGFNRVLLDNISALLPSVDAYAYPSVSPRADALTLRLFVDEFLGSLNGEVVLKGMWVLYSPKDKKSAEKKFKFSAKASGSFDSYAEAMNALIFQLCQQISTGIAGLTKTK